MSSLTWRATFWFCFAFALFIFSMVFIAFPETFRHASKFDVELPVTANKSALSSTETVERSDNSNSTCSKLEGAKVSQEDNKEQTAPINKKGINPIAPFLLLRHPFILFAAMASGIAFGCMFAIETITPDLYETQYGFNSWKTGKPSLFI